MAADLDTVFAALADPTRRAILTALVGGDRTVGELARPHAMSLAAVSKHVTVLVRAGLVSQLRAGRVTTCRLEPDGLRAAGIWMQGMGGFDPEDYDALEELVAAALGERAAAEPFGYSSLDNAASPPEGSAGRRAAQSDPGRDE